MGRFNTHLTWIYNYVKMSALPYLYVCKHKFAFIYTYLHKEVNLTFPPVSYISTSRALQVSRRLNASYALPSNKTYLCFGIRSSNLKAKVSTHREDSNRKHF